MTWGNAQVRVSHCLLRLFVHIFFRWESKGGVPIFRRMTFLLLLTKGGSFPPSWNDTWNVLDPKANPELVWNHDGHRSVGTWACGWREGLSFPPNDCLSYSRLIQGPGAMVLFSLEKHLFLLNSTCLHSMSLGRAWIRHSISGCSKAWSSKINRYIPSPPHQLLEVPPKIGNKYDWPVFVLGWVLYHYYHYFVLFTVAGNWISSSKTSHVLPERDYGRKVYR